MEKINSIKSKLKEIENLKNEIISGLKDLPENSKTEKSEKSFIMKFKDIDQKSMNLSSKFYNFNFQYNAIAKELEKTNIENFDDKIKKICKEGKINNEQLHPEVIQNIKKYFEI